MITKGPELQEIPTKLATDIRAYFVERRKRVMSPEMQLLDVSVTSDSVANTVYTFCDREKTAEAHVSNPTDTALAQLYAYIQTLPESSKKRKLVKQFNKENGQGAYFRWLYFSMLSNAKCNTNIYFDFRDTAANTNAMEIEEKRRKPGQIIEWVYQKAYFP